MRQRDLTLVVQIREKRAAVEAELDSLGAEVRSDHNPFRDVEDLHFLGAFVIDGVECGPACAVLELDFDGPRRRFLERLVEGKRAELERIFSRCEGYPLGTSNRKIFRFLWRRRVRSGTFYVGHPGRSVERIQRERELRTKARAWVASKGFVTRSQLWRALQAELRPAAAEPLPLWVRLSTRGRRGPRRIAAGAWLLFGGLLRVIGAVAFVALAWWAWENHPAYRPVVVGGPLALPALIGLAAYRERPRHLKLRGLGPVVWAAAHRGLWMVAGVAIGVGVVALLVDAWWAPWASESFFPVELSSGAIRILAAVLVALVAAVLGVGAGVLAFLLLGRIAGVGVGVVATGAALAGSGAGSLFLAQPFETGRFLATLGFAAGAMALLFAVAFGYLLVLRRRERADAVGGIRWDIAQLASVTEHEDLQLQNHFASLTEIKDGLRLYQLRVVLRLASLLVRFHFNQGDLAGIPSIHFARFILLPHRRFLFVANYDAGWANYLGEFTHVPGVTAVWGSTRLFPRPFLIFGDGARDEQRFKSRARASQLKTRVWHSAYRGLSVSDVNRNTRLREDLARPVLEGKGKEWTGWPAGVWRYWRRPLDGAGLDEAIRGL